MLYTRLILRRRMLLALSGLIPAGFAANRFWESRPPSQWTPEEIQQLIANSPWAKQVTAQYRIALESHQPRKDSAPQTGGRGEGRGGECGLVPCGNIMPGTVAVIWESAQPIREALRPVIPPDFNGHYVLSLRGVEMELSEAGLLAGSTLELKGQSPVQAGLARQRNATWLVGFNRELLPLTPASKEVQLSVKIGPSFSSTLLRATFNPKEMVYRGALAV